MDGLASLAAAATIIGDYSVQQSPLKRKVSFTNQDSSKRKSKQNFINVESNDSDDVIYISNQDNNEETKILKDSRVDRIIKGLSPMVRIQCKHEWFYSTLDREYFQENEFVSCLQLLGLRKVTNLTQEEWSIVRGIMGSEIGRPRRFSSSFLKSEREKLHNYRMEVRCQQYDLQRPSQGSNGRHANIQYEIYQPVHVGDCVTSYHTASRSLQRGLVLTHDEVSPHSSVFRVQFDRSDLGHDLVHDYEIAVHGENEVKMIRHSQALFPPSPYMNAMRGMNINNNANININTNTINTINTSGGTGVNHNVNNASASNISTAGGGTLYSELSATSSTTQHPLTSSMALSASILRAEDSNISTNSSDNNDSNIIGAADEFGGVFGGSSSESQMKNAFVDMFQVSQDNIQDELIQNEVKHLTLFYGLHRGEAETNSHDNSDNNENNDSDGNTQGLQMDVEVNEGGIPISTKKGLEDVWKVCLEQAIQIVVHFYFQRFLSQNNNNDLRSVIMKKRHISSEDREVLVSVIPCIGSVLLIRHVSSATPSSKGGGEGKGTGTGDVRGGGDREGVLLYRGESVPGLGGDRDSDSASASALKGIASLPKLSMSSSLTSLSAESDGNSHSDSLHDMIEIQEVDRGADTDCIASQVQSQTSGIG